MDILSSEQRLAIPLVLQRAPMPIIITRFSDGVVLLANDHLASFVGLTAQSMVGKRAPDFYADPEERDAVMKELATAGQLTDVELRLKGADGRQLWAVASIALTELAGERVVVSALNDITARKDAEQALRASEEKFRTLVEHANDIIYTLTPGGVFTYVSPNWTTLLGHDVTEIEGRSFAPLVHPDDLDACFAFLTAVVERGERQQGIEYRVQHKDGTWRWHTSNGAPVVNDDGRIESYIGIARDITDKKEAQQALESAHRELRRAQAQLLQTEKMAALGKLVAGIAHELNSPVGAINSIRQTIQHAAESIDVELASANVTPSRKLRTAIDAIKDGTRVLDAGGERIDRVVHRLRSFARLDEAEIKQVDLHDGLDSTLELLEGDLGGRIDVVRSYGDLPPVLCAPGRLNQVFLNLLMNAIQAIDGNGTIEVATRSAPPDSVEVRFTDSGKGIPADHMPRIFDPGFTTKGVGVGTGLGLPICYQIVQEHGGSIRVDAATPRGTCVSVVLPQRIDLRQKSQVAATGTPRPASDRPR